MLEFKLGKIVLEHNTTLVRQRRWSKLHLSTWSRRSVIRPVASSALLSVGLIVASVSIVVLILAILAVQVELGRVLKTIVVFRMTLLASQIFAWTVLF